MLIVNITTYIIKFEIKLIHLKINWSVTLVDEIVKDTFHKENVPSGG